MIQTSSLPLFTSPKTDTNSLPKPIDQDDPTTTLLPLPPHALKSLPSLSHVLNRVTSAPLCLYNFYLYIRTEEPAYEPLLDFWLDVSAHEQLWNEWNRQKESSQAPSTTPSMDTNVIVLSDGYDGISDDEVKESAELIVRDYIHLHSRRYIPLQGIHRARVLAHISDKNYSPFVFLDSKQHIYNCLGPPYKRFLNSKCRCNIGIYHRWFSLFIGCIAIATAVAIGFSLILVNSRPEERLWVVLPFFIGILQIWASWEGFVGWLGLLGRR